MVERVDRDMVAVRFTPHQSPSEQCVGCRACSAAGGAMRALVPLAGSFTVIPGQIVTVRRFVVNPAFAGGIVFGLPVAFMLAVLLAGARVLPTVGDSPALFMRAVAGLTAGALCAWLIQRVIDRATGDPQIVRVNNSPAFSLQGRT